MSDPTGSAAAVHLGRGRKLLFAAIIAVMTAGSIEVLSRACLSALGPSGNTFAASGDWLARMAEDLGGDAPVLYEPDPTQFWRLRPGLDAELTNRVFETRSDPPTWHLRINRDGQRGRPFPAAGPSPLVVALGDSCTFGFRVGEADTYPARLEQYLQAHGRRAAAVVNLGVPGYTSFQGRRLLDRLLAERRPEVVILAFGANDHELDRMPDAVRAQRVSLRRLRAADAIGGLGVVRLARRLAGAEERAAEVGDAATRRVSAAEYRANLTYMAQRAREAGAKVILLDLVFTTAAYRPIIESVARAQGVAWVDGREVLRSGLDLVRSAGRFDTERAAIDRFWRDQVLSFRHIYYDAAYYQRLFADPERRDLLRYLMVEPVHAGPLGNRVIAEAVGDLILAGAPRSGG